MAKNKQRNSLKGIERNTKVISDAARLQIFQFKAGLVVALILGFILFILLLSTL